MVEFNSADEFYETAAQGGTAFRFQDIDGIGPATADKITSVRSVQAPTDVKDMSADELADKASISRSRASKAIRGAGGNPSISKTQSNSGSVSAAGINSRQGDFWVGFAELDKARARNDARSRSKEAVRQDERKRAPVTTDLETWKDNPSRWDFPGVDTPSQEPGVRPKDYKAGGELDTAEFDERGQAEFDDQEQETFPRKKDAASGKSNFILETGEDRIVASDVASDIPDVPGIAPGMSPRDIEREGGESMFADGPGGPKYNIHDGRVRETDRVDEEQNPPETALERQSSGSGRRAVSLPKRTLADINTELNERVHGESREDLRDLRGRVRRAQYRGDDEPLPLPISSSEQSRLTTMLRERKEEAEDRAERMEANIFGSTEEQAETAREAFRGMIGNPGR